MSGQYPSGYNNPMGRQFNPQQQQQQMQMNPMMNVGAQGGAAGGGGGGMMMPMGGYGGAQQPNQMSGAMGGMSPVGMQQQQLMQQQQMQQQMQHQQQMGGQAGPSMAQQQQQQHPHQNVPPAHPTGGGSMLLTQQLQPKEINIVALSRLGQETVQDITSRFQEIFAALKIIQPTANRDNNTEKKVQEYFRTIRLLFKRVRIIYEKCNDGYPQGMEYAHVESLIPYKDERDHRMEATQCEEYRKALQENQELIETVKLKNRQLREIIDRTRIIIWEINTMLSMRRS